MGRGRTEESEEEGGGERRRSRNIQAEDALRSAQSRAGMGAAPQHYEGVSGRTHTWEVWQRRVDMECGGAGAHQRPGAQTKKLQSRDL